MPRITALNILTQEGGNPEATDHWFDTAKARNGEYWINGVKERIGGR